MKERLAKYPPAPHELFWDPQRWIKNRSKERQQMESEGDVKEDYRIGDSSV